MQQNTTELLELDSVELVPHFAIQDPLIQQIGLALHTGKNGYWSGGDRLWFYSSKPSPSALQTVDECHSASLD